MRPHPTPTKQPLPAKKVVGVMPQKGLGRGQVAGKGGGGGGGGRVEQQAASGAGGKVAAVQKRVFRKWMNCFLRLRNYEVKDLLTDTTDGLAYLNLLEVLTGESVGRFDRVPRHRIQKIGNCSLAVKFVSDRVKLVGIGGEDLADAKETLVLGFIWTIILRLHINRGVKEDAHDELLRWVQSRIPAYGITNFTDNWRDGKAILALLESVGPGTVALPAAFASPKENVSLALRLAEEKCGIPQLLEAEDMTTVANDLTNRTYISFFRDFVDSQKELPLKPPSVQVFSKKGEEPKRAFCLIRGKDHSYRAHIDDEGTVVSAYGTCLGYVADGQVASAEQIFLGSVQGDQVLDENDVEVGSIDRGTGCIHDALGSTVFEVDGTGQAKGQTSVYLGEFRNLDGAYHHLNMLALYVLFLDPTFAREDLDE